MVNRSSAVVLVMALVFAAVSVRADVSLTDPKGYRKQVHRAATRGTASTNATGSVALIDNSGFKWFINTDITFSTSSSASAAMSEASYTHAVAATTLNGGNTSSTLNDAYDGYQTLCLSLTGATTTCQTGNAAFVIYNKNGPATVDATVPATPACTGRQELFATQTIGALQVYRKVFVPNNDQFARWLNVVKNTSGAPVTFNAIIANNLGSDSNTTITGSSSGDLVATTADTWVGTFQNYSGTTSSDPREAHVLQGVGADVPLNTVNFANGDDNPFWVYSITLAPGATASVVNYAVAQPSKAAAHTKGALLATTPLSAQQCLSGTEMDQVVNFKMANLVQNGGFENNTGWTTVGFTGSDNAVTTTASVGARSVQIVGANTVNKRLKQTIAVAGVAGDSYLLSGASKTTASRLLPDHKYDVFVEFNNTDGTKSAFAIRFTRGAHAWESLTKTYTTTKPYSSISVQVRYFKQTGTANFDAIGLRRTN